MAEPIRPANVGEEAVMIPPSLTQANTIASIETANAHDNYEALKGWAHGMRDWATNARADYNADQPIKPHPQKPAVYRTQTTYADQGGTVKTGPRADDGQNYAWLETIVT